MKAVFGITLFLATGILAACAAIPGEQPPGTQSEESSNSKTIYVGPELVDCVGVAPQKCLQVKENPDDEYSLFYGTIEGFEFEEGNEYVIIVQEEEIATPPADASSISWTLVRIESQEPAAGSQAPAGLEDQLWKLVTMMNAEGQLAGVLPETEITLEFVEGRLSGNAGCNNYFSSYEVDGNNLSIEAVASTEMFCQQPEGVMDQESAYLSTLGMAASYSIEAENLEIVDAEGTVILNFSTVEPVSLSGTNWQVVNYFDGESAVVSSLVGSELTVMFGADGNISGSGGCNRYSGSYEVTGENIAIGPLVRTLMACLEPEGVMDQEDAFLAALESAVTYRIQSNRLTLFNAEGNIVVVSDAIESKSLTGNDWTLTMYNNGNQALVSTLAGSEITAIFGEDGRLSGSAGCNNYNSTFTIDGERITIGPAASTRKACSTPEGIMDQEAAYLAALGNVLTYQMSGDELVLSDESGTSILFYTVSQ